MCSLLMYSESTKRSKRNIAFITRLYPIKRSKKKRKPNQRLARIPLKMLKVRERQIFLREFWLDMLRCISMLDTMVLLDVKIQVRLAEKSFPTRLTI